MVDFTLSEEQVSLREMAHDFAPNGEYANWYTVYAKTDKEAGHRGISAFVVSSGMPA